MRALDSPDALWAVLGAIVDRDADKVLITAR
jgi:hypothetical protein